MNIGNFLQKENINMLWDVISDEDIFKFLTRDVQSKISQLFLNNITGFFETERTKTNNITDINKKYILLILNHIKKNYPYQMPNKIKIEEPIKNVKELITYEEIQNDRASQFEKDLNKRQEEFTNAMTLKVPNVPEFSDNFADTPIKDMDKIIKEMTSKRNYEVEQINRNYSNNNSDNGDNWLKPQETSIKKEKFSTEMPKKNVTWGENTESEFEVEDSIFKKLKRVEEPSNNISISFEESSTEDKINTLHSEIKTLNTKIDTIIKLLNKK